ncbi:MAG TPA: DUF1592 domain-containing protein [Pirellulales bacterium]
MHTIVYAPIGLLLTLCLFTPTGAAEPDSFAALADDYTRVARPIVARFCVDCHSTADREGELDLERFAALDQVRTAPEVWQKVAEMLDLGEMPPKDAEQPSPDERRQLRAWVERCLNALAQANAGDPGPVVLRRLNNAQYTFTVRDLTRLDLDPAREFPADGAAGEGFTNAGAALAMSPALLSKYLDAGKAIAGHAALLPAGFRFSPGTTRRDWSDELIGQIKQFYARFADGEGRLPLDRYFAATLDEREALVAGQKTIAAVAAERGLNARYLQSLWTLLHAESDTPPPPPSLLLEMLRSRWQTSKAGEAAALTNEVAVWQKALSRFQSVGHLKPWIVPINPLTARHEIRLKMPEAGDAKEVTLYLTAGTAGDGPAGDVVLWQSPRLVTPGHPDLLLRDVREVARQLVARRQRLFAATAKCLAAAEAGAAAEAIDRAQLAAKHDVERESLDAWLDYLGLDDNAAIRLEHFTAKLERTGEHDFVQGWGSGETPNLVANSSDRHVRIPGNMKPHAVAVHPSPKLNVAVGWQSPLAGHVRIRGQVTHAHPECGNGVTWSLEWRRGRMRQPLAAGIAHGTNAVKVELTAPLPVRPGDFVSLVIGPRDGNHACDLTDVELVIEAAGEGGRRWSLTSDVSGNVLAGNPHADGFGNANVWHFYTEPVTAGNSLPSIPSGCVLARWQLAAAAAEKLQLAGEVERLLLGDPPADKNHPDAALYKQLTSLSGPLFAAVGVKAASETESKPPSDPPVPPGDANRPAAEQVAWGIDVARFGRSPDGAAIDGASLGVQAPAVIEVRLPADLVAGCELVTTGVLHSPADEASVQLAVTRSPPADLQSWRGDAPVLAKEAAPAWQRFETAFEDFRRLFPAALCYSRLVPVDEVITLAQFHREDEPLMRLMLDDEQRTRLNRLWDELHFVSRDALTIVDSYAQLMEYATQDSDPRLFEHLREPIQRHADELRRRLVESEPRQLDALVDFAAQVFRRPITSAEAAELRGLYQRLRAQPLPHEQAFRLTLARLFVSPAFLYRLEESPPGTPSAAVSSWELANRLSYFLWSSSGDVELRESAAAGRLVRPDVLREQARRMLRDGRVRRLATEFACQWLHIYDFDALDEKSERHFPSFAGLRGDMYEEAIRFFTDLFQRDGSVLEIWDCDHLFVNEALAAHYGIPGVTGDWRRIDGARRYGRGGILTLAATLAKQSGASRTSPILRGNWISEALLGERLPRPPKDTPPLPDDETAADSLTVRQLTEKHTSDARCAGCHVRIDPLGFALEGYDAIGGRREKDVSGRPIDAHARLPGGAEFDGLEGLRAYLLTARRDVILRQFCRKLLGYALGRAVRLSDKPLLERIERDLQDRDYRFSAAIETIVGSRQFCEIRGREQGGE